ncbi:MAG: hypothetical protein HOP15_01495 [Planctomycetes bacterium]|nr:hypothetical protein [Planctomycetota bacterium]
MQAEPANARPWVPRWVCWYAPLLAALVVAVLVWLPRDVGINMTDEGFLWYGVQRTVAGDVPMRDFQAYDPGRYLWCAAFVPLLGDGILGVRGATALFAALGLALALLVAGRFTRHPGELFVCALVLGLWLFPRHKLFEPALASAALWFTVRLIESPTPLTHLASGVFVGASAFFGRNHALYAGLALGLCAVFLAWKRPELRGARRAGAFALGVALGLVPLGWMLCCVPGFAAGYARSLRLVLEHGANLTLPYPFPWRTAWSALAGWELAGQIALSTAFLAPFLLLPAGLWTALRTPAAALRARAPVLAAFFAGAVYVHHASVRSDASHLAQSFAPLAVLALALSTLSAARGVRALAWGTLGLVSALAALEANTVLTRFRPDQGARLVACEVAGESLRLPVGQATLLRALQDFAAELLPGETPIWIVNQPTLYAVLRKSAPSWWLFFYWPEDDEAQRAHVQALEQRDVDFVLVHLGQADGSEARGFRNTHPLVWQHLLQEFRLLHLPGLPSNLQLFRKRT